MIYLKYPTTPTLIPFNATSQDGDLNVFFFNFCINRFIVYKHSTVDKVSSLQIADNERIHLRLLLLFILLNKFLKK